MLLSFAAVPPTTREPAQVDDVIELQQVLARYAVGMTQDDVEAVVDVFTPDGTYSAFGETHTLKDFPSLVAAAPKGLFLTGTPVLDLDRAQGTGTGYQTLCFVDQTTHHMRIGWYTDTYRRTDAGWRLHTRAMTFLRRNGTRDSGRPHDPGRPLPSGGDDNAG
jgi:SnoaL-like domain